MRHLLPALLLATASAHAQSDDLLYGAEAVTGYRTESIFRGFKLANDVLDVQLQTQVALSNQWLVDVGGYYATGSNGFEEAAAFADLTFDRETWNAGINFSARYFDHALFNSGLDVGPFLNLWINDDLRVGGRFTYDTGADGTYGAIETEWSKPLDEKSFVNVLAGVSRVNDYYDRRGMNDLYGRLSYSYEINRHVALTPYLGTSLPLTAEASPRLFAGVWFEVNF